LKKFLFMCVIFFLALAVSQVVYGAQVYFEHTTRRTPSRGVVYERVMQMTSIGMRDVHILRVPLGDAYIHVAPVASRQDVGRRETTTALLSSAGAVAGINADFFNMVAGNHAVHLGPMVYDGQLIAANLEANRYNSALAAFFIDVHNNPFFRYLHISMYLYVNGERERRINYYNNIGNTLNQPKVFSYAAMGDTAALDARFPYTFKVVSDGVRIVHVSAVGETVYIPPGGFVLVVPDTVRYENLRFTYRVGDWAQLRATNNFDIDLSMIQSGIGGGGMLLERGNTVNDGGLVPTGRHPRTAVGVCREGLNLILMVVDGRGASVGATHTELAELMRRAGAYYAMHFDGGGSSTMVVQEQGGHYRVMNAPSDGAQRRVANALGVFDTALPGEMTGITLEMAQLRAAVGTPIASTVLARDALGLRFPLPPDANVAFMVLDRAAGFWQDGYYTPLRAGEHTVNVWHDHLWATQVIQVVEIAELHAEPVSLLSGEAARLHFSGTGVDGSTLPDVNVRHFVVEPDTLGRVEDNYFHASTGFAGVGHIRAWVGNVVAYIPVSVGDTSAPVNFLTSGITFSGYPAFVTGAVHIAQVGAHRIPRLEYRISNAPETQAAHMEFDPPLAIPVTPGHTPSALRLQVHGDGSGHWMRGRVIDANGLAHNIDFTRNADFTGWDRVTAQLPANAPGPFTLDRIWMVTLGASEYSQHVVYFYNLQALYAPLPLPEVPQGARFRDPTQTHGAFTGIPGGAAHELTLPATTEAYRFNQLDNVAIIRLMSNNAGLTERSQWEQIRRDIHRSNPDHVIILMSTSPLRFPQMAYTLFHTMLRTFADEGRGVFVASPASGIAETELTVRDGVRYIRVPLPETGNAQIRFWTDANGRQIWWYA